MGWYIEATSLHYDSLNLKYTATLCVTRASAEIFFDFKFQASLNFLAFLFQNESINEDFVGFISKLTFTLRKKTNEHFKGLEKL